MREESIVHCPRGRSSGDLEKGREICCTSPALLEAEEIESNSFLFSVKCSVYFVMLYHLIVKQIYKYPLCDYEVYMGSIEHDKYYYALPFPSIPIFIFLPALLLAGIYCAWVLRRERSFLIYSGIALTIFVGNINVVLLAVILFFRARGATWAGYSLSMFNPSTGLPVLFDLIVTRKKVLLFPLSLFLLAVLVNIDAPIRAATDGNLLFAWTRLSILVPIYLTVKDKHL